MNVLKFIRILAVGLILFNYTFAQNVGIGEPNPGSKLSVKGGLSVGSTYSSQTAPVGGIIVEGQIGIGTTTPDSSALIDLTSTTQGFLPPRMTAAQRTAIVRPTNGLIVFDTDTNMPYYYHSGWQKFVASSSPTGTAGGDLSGSYPNPAVKKVNGFTFGSITPTSGNILTANGTQWQSKTLSGDVTIDSSAVATLKNTGTAGTYTKITTDAKGRVSSGTTLTSSDIPDLSTVYIKNQTAQQSASNFNISGNGVIGGTLTLSPITAGSVLFSGTSGLLSQDNSNLFWNSTNHRLGIGTASPSSKLSVGSSSQFQVDDTGNVVKINNVATSFPSSQGAAGTVLTNDGSGNLSWSTVSGIGIPTYKNVSGSNATNSTTAFVDITGLSVALTGGSSYEFEAVLSANSGTANNSGNGITFAVNYTGSITSITGWISGTSDYGATGHAVFQRITGLATAPSPNPYLAVKNTDGGVLVKGIITTSAGSSGNLTIQHKIMGPTQSGYTSTIYQGSYLKVTKIN